MTQHPVERRYKRLAVSNNRKAERLGLLGRISHEDLVAVFRRSGGSCTYCGIGITSAGCSFDHVVPFDRGGENTEDNIVACCVTCQREKFTKTPEEFAQYRSLEVACAGCGTLFRPRWADWIRGYGRYHSRSCSGAAGGAAK